MLKSIIQKGSYCIVLLLFCTISFIAQAVTPKNHHSYPDVWGYDLSEFPAMKWGLAGVTPYAMDDGDIWFVVDYSYKKTNPMDLFSPTTDDQYVLIKFFKGEQTILNDQEREKLFKITEGKEIFLSYLHDKDVVFSDKSKLSVHRRIRTKRCFVPDFWGNYLVKTDSNGTEKNYSILAASTQVSIHQSDLDCVAEGNSSFLYQKLHALTDIIPLKDDSFIVFSTSEPNIILRFDKDFKTKFKPITPVTMHGSDIMRNFFVIDYALIEDLYTQFTGKSTQVYQRIHDALLTHFQEQYPHK